MRIYLDVSCLNRPFDDQFQPRLRLESEAVTVILDRIDKGVWQQVSSRIAEIEIAAISDEVRRRRVQLLLSDDRIGLDQAIFARARELIADGLHAADAVHIAAAEATSADVFLTCDDRLLRQCHRIADKITVVVANPLAWLEEQDNAANP